MVTLDAQYRWMKGRGMVVGLAGWLSTPVDEGHGGLSSDGRPANPDK